MSADAQTPPAADSSPSKMKAMMPFALALVLGLAVGGASGVFVVGPAMAKGISPAASAARPARGTDATASAEDASAEGGDGEAKPGESTNQVYTLDNLVLNPAESGGTRFLLLSVAFETTSAALLEDMKTRDAELRDAVLVTLGAKTVEQLADMRLREQIKAELTVAARKLFKKKATLRIYFPQFVIQ
ncbi:flagellar basal body-associated protein FliL [Gemmatirosa kalamazoonensis]|jgi:flagellar FliL protein|uniref:Flagellar protein FliL n=1 Tax=Gemmatirosa kalamazoonensis TaxID=861299 RepID=W0RBB6_9BACT|nr:flagellar basal body-associated FliL family protein [Gemmatirosa kalamazoonensis]AHG87732.1 flagellar basal body-associated protein FliL [Gemmatirosa kalamazoonensis]